MVGVGGRPLQCRVCPRRLSGSTGNWFSRFHCNSRKLCHRSLRPSGSLRTARTGATYRLPPTPHWSDHGDQRNLSGQHVLNATDQKDGFPQSPCVVGAEEDGPIMIRVTACRTPASHSGSACQNKANCRSMISAGTPVMAPAILLKKRSR